MYSVGGQGTWGNRTSLRAKEGLGVVWSLLHRSFWTCLMGSQREGQGPLTETKEMFCLSVRMNFLKI